MEFKTWDELNKMPATEQVEHFIARAFTENHSSDLKGVWGNWAADWRGGARDLTTARAASNIALKNKLGRDAFLAARIAGRFIQQHT